MEAFLPDDHTIAPLRWAYQQRGEEDADVAHPDVFRSKVSAAQAQPFTAVKFEAEVRGDASVELHECTTLAAVVDRLKCVLGDSTRLRTSDLLVDVVVGLRFSVTEELHEDGTHQRHLALGEVSTALRAFRLGPQELTNLALDLPADICELDQVSTIDPSRTAIPERGQPDDFVGHVSSNEQRKTLTKFTKNVKDSPKNLIFCQKCAIFSHINSPMFTMRGETKWIPPQGTGPIRRERRRQLKGGIEVPKSFEGERVKEQAENPYGVVEMKKRFIKNEIDNAVPMDTPDRDLVIEQLVDRAYTGPTQSEFFKAKTKAEMRGVVEQVLTEQGMGSEPESQMTAQEAQAEAARVLEEEMRKRGHEINKAKKGLESVYGDQPIEGDAVEVVSAGDVSETQTDYKTETVEVPLSREEEAAAAEAERALQQELAARGLAERPTSEEIAMPSAEEEELPELSDEDIEALDDEDKPKAAAIGLTSGVAGSAMGAQKEAGQKTAPETGASKEVAQVDRAEFLNKLAEQRKEQLKQKMESGMTLEDLNEMLDYEIQDADMDIEELEDDQESLVQQAINKREVALKLKEWLASQSENAAAAK